MGDDEMRGRSPPSPSSIPPCTTVPGSRFSYLPPPLIAVFPSHTPSPFTFPHSSSLLLKPGLSASARVVPSLPLPSPFSKSPSICENMPSKCLDASELLEPLLLPLPS
jgi:hypothetical protein